jgi:DNA primase large subunit
LSTSLIAELEKDAANKERELEQIVAELRAARERVKELAQKFYAANLALAEASARLIVEKALHEENSAT